MGQRGPGESRPGSHHSCTCDCPSVAVPALLSPSCHATSVLAVQVSRAQTQGRWSILGVTGEVPNSSHKRREAGEGGGSTDLGCVRQTGESNGEKAQHFSTGRTHEGPPTRKRVPGCWADRGPQAGLVGGPWGQGGPSRLVNARGPQPRCQDDSGHVSPGVGGASRQCWNHTGLSWQ